MSPAPPASSEPPAPTADAGTVRLAAAGYAAVLLASLVATAVVAVDVGVGVPAVLVGAATGAIVGAVTGWLVADRIDDAGVRLGRSWLRRWVPAALAIPFGAAALAPAVGPFDPSLSTVGWLATLAVFLAGSALARLAQNRHVTTLAAGEPLAQSRWEPRGSLRLDLLLVALWAALAISNVVVGRWSLVALWTTTAVAWLARSADDGRLGRNGRSPVVQVYGNGIVRRRRYTANFVPWEDVSHARLRDGEIVVDRGLLDLRVDVVDLADPDGLFAAIEDAGPTTIR